MPRLLPSYLLLLALPIWAAEEPVTPPPPVPRPAAAGLATPAARLPLPPAETIEAAQRSLRETLKDDYTRARKPEERLVLGRKLLEQALTMVGADTERLAMLREAADLAARAGEATVALEAVDAQAARFVMPQAEERLRILVIAVVKLASSESAQAAGEALCGLVDDGIAADDYPFAQRAVKEADALGRRLKDAAFAARTKALVERVKLLADEFEKVGEITDPLGNTPPDAHLRMGRFLCFIKGDWPRGLPHLATGDDAALKAAAQSELAAGGEGAAPDAQLKVAEGWYEIGQKQRGAVKEEVQVHSLAWYRRAATTLQGPARIKLDKRLDELERAVSATGRRIRYPHGAVLMLTFERETLTLQGTQVTQVLDASGHNLRAVATGMLTAESGGHGTALNLDGKSWLTIANTKELQISGNQTIAFWIRPHTLVARTNPFNKSYCDEGSMALEPDGALNYFYGISTDKPRDQGILLVAAATVKRWTHVALVRDLTAKKLTWFKDGKKDIEAAAKFAATTLSTADLLIGTGYISPFVGQLDDVGLWPRALTAAEVKQMYDATSTGR